MNVNFSLADASKSITAIRITISSNGKRYRSGCGLSVNPATWNQTKQRTTNQSIQSKLNEIRHFLETSLNDKSNDKEIKIAFAHVKNGNVNETLIIKSNRSFWGYFLEWSERKSVVARQRQLIYRTIKRLMGDNDDWNDINEGYYMRLIQRLNDAEYSKNYQATIVSKIKVVMNEGMKLGYHNNMEFHKFKKPVADVDSVYLTEDELEKIWNVKLYNSTEEKCRDLLILGCYTGARWEDFSQFTNANIVDGRFRYIQHKTGMRVIIPLSPKVEDVLNRNEGKAPKLNSISFNKTIKVVCERAGINDMIEVRHSKGAMYVHETLPKFKLISSHCCRRTLCTLLAKKNIPINQIMQVSGHKNLSSLQKYLRQSISETADELAKIDFFK